MKIFTRRFRRLWSRIKPVLRNGPFKMGAKGADTGKTGSQALVGLQIRKSLLPLSGQNFLQDRSGLVNELANEQKTKYHVVEDPEIVTRNTGENDQLLVKGPGGFEYVGPESQVGLALKTLVQVFRSITRVIIAIIWAILSIIFRDEIIGFLG